VLQELRVFSKRPAPRSGHRCCATVDRLLVYGGYDKDNNHTVYSEILSFSLISRQWTELSRSRNVRLKSASSSMVLYDDNLVIFGGSGFPFGGFNSNDLSLFSLRTGQWRKLRSDRGSPPLPKYGQSMVITPHSYEPKLYIFSGTIGREFVDELHCYDLANETWHDIWKEGAPLARYRHEVVVYGNDFYVFGGATYDGVIDLHDIWKFSFTSHRWYRLECKPFDNGIQDEFPAARKSHSCIIWKDTVYMCGGIDNHAETFNDIWKISLIDLEWKKLNVVLPTKIYFHSAAVTPDGCMYIFGGVDSLGKRLSSLYSLWLTVPSLLKITFSYILNQLGENCDHYSILSRLGIPKSLLNSTFKDNLALRNVSFS